MRKRLLSLAAVALVASACGGSASSAPGASQPRVPQDHHQPGPSFGWWEPQPRPTPYDGVTYEDPGTNPYVDPVDDRASTFGLDVDTASYTIAQRYVADGYLPDPASVRVEEFVNFFDQGYAVPEEETFAIHADGGPSPFLRPDELLLRVGLQARDTPDGFRPNASLTFVVDVSGSMAREDRLGLVKQSLALLVDALGRDDTVAIVVYGSEARVVLPPTRSTERDDILGAIGSLHPEGSTNAEAGLVLGYQMAEAQFREEGINRVVLASDGVANVGATDPQQILGRIRDGADTGIQLVSVGVGMGNFNDALLEQLADDGDGFYAYIDTLDEARRLFVDDLTGTLQTVALDARVQVEFDPAVVAAYRLIGFENRAIDDDDFRDDDVDAGAIGAGHSVTALYAIRFVEEAGPQGRLGTVSLRWIDPQSTRARELVHDVDRSDLARDFGATAPAFQLDAIVVAAAERFKANGYDEGYRLHDVANLAFSVAEGLPSTPEVADFLTFIERAARLER